MLEWKSCQFGYERSHALFQDFSLTLEQSATVVGPSGSGKSTLLASIVGLVPFLDGSIRVGGRTVVGDPALSRRYVSYLSSANVMPVDLSVIEYLSDLGRIDGLTARRARQQAHTLLERLHLTEVFDRRLGRLSGGMKRRTLLAGCLLRPSEWLLVDEPTAGLDPEEQRTVLDLLRAESEQRGVLMVTHELTETQLFPDRMLLIQSARILFDGPPSQLRESAASHVFAGPSTELMHTADGSLRTLWHPTADRDRVKVYASEAPAHGQALTATVEDGYFWQLLQEAHDGD